MNFVLANIIFVTLVTSLKFKENGSNYTLADTYSQTIANRTLMFAYGAYCSSSSLSAWNCKWCEYIPEFEMSSVIDRDDLQAFVGYDKQASQIVVSFRGSSNIVDWLDDLTYNQVPYPGVENGMIHQGFYDAWEEVYDEVMSATKTLMNDHKGTTILVTGHSLGAAMAQIAAMDVKKYASSISDNAQIQVYTYGSPRWGNLALVQYYATTVNLNWRLVNVHDVVPTVPPTEIDGYSYHHTWTEVWYTLDMPLTYEVCNGSGEDPACSYVITSIDDHLMYMDLYESCT